VLVCAGDLVAADASVAETQTIEEAVGIVSAPYGAVTLSAWRGRGHEAGELIEITMRCAQARREGVGVAISEYGTRDADQQRPGPCGLAGFAHHLGPV
jgi:hypothetical protein